MEELEILQRQFEDAAKEFGGMSHKFAWRGNHKEHQLIPIELKIVFRKPSLNICLRQWPYNITQDNDWGSHFDYAHFLIKPRRTQWDSADALRRLDTLARKLFPYISKVEKSLHSNPLYAYWNDNPTYQNDMVFNDQVIGYDTKLLLTMHILTKSEKLCIVDGHTEVKEGEPYIRTIDNVFLDGALVCAKLRDLIDGKPDERKAYIKKKRSVWIFGFNGEAAQVEFQPGKELKGLALIEFLLKHRGKEYGCLKLLQAVRQREEGETESEKIYTAADIEKVKEAIKGLEGRYNLSCDTAEKERLEQEIEKAKDELRKTRNCCGKSRNISDKDRLSVLRNINTVLSKIAPQNAERLYSHLDNFLKRGEICYYKPDKKVFWEIS